MTAETPTPDSASDEVPEDQTPQGDAQEATQESGEAVSSEDDLSLVLDRIDEDLDESLERLFEILKISSISTNSEHIEDCKKAARWTGEYIAYSGFQSAVYPTGGHYMVLGQYRPLVEHKVPHVLFYGHYDVQPVDPVGLWDTDPFEPQIIGEGEEARIVARGASDDKGQFLTFFEACRALLAERGELPIAVTVLIEGEEECGSPSLAPFLEGHKEELQADFAMICDTAMWDANTPAISTRLRGLLDEEVTIIGPDRDLHSGLFGGPAVNPIGVLAKLLASLHDDDGRVNVEGFYDGVEDISPELKAQWRGLGLNETKFMTEIGLTDAAGEEGYSILEKLWSRPTLEFNGIHGGYTEEGSKTIVPHKASAKITCRLVGEQDPAKLSKALRSHLEARLPKGAKIEFGGGHGAPGMVMPQDEPYFQKTAAALSDEWGRETAMIGCGGSIPIVESFKERLGIESVLVGFALDDDRIHSHNEKYNVSSFRKGIRSWARIMDALAAK